MREAKDTFAMLRTDAIERGMIDLGIVYGWSAIRLGREYLDKYAMQMEAYRRGAVAFNKSKES